MGKAPDRKKLGTHVVKLQVELTAKELLERGKSLGAVHQQAREHQGEVSVLKAKLKAKEEELQESILTLANALHTGAEPRDVKVEAWADYSTGTFEEVRLDTGATITKRSLLEHEKQMPFDKEEWKETLESRTQLELSDMGARKEGAA